MTILFAGTCFVIYFCFGSEHFYQENALFELGQNLLLFGGVTAFYAATSISKDKTCQAIMWGLTLFCVTMFLREVDVRGTSLDPYLHSVFEGHIHYVVLSIFWVGLFFMVIGKLAATWRKAVLWMFSPSGAWLIAGIVFYLIGDMAEKNLFTKNDGLAQMVEESAELLGTLFVFYAGYVSLRRQARFTASHQTLSPDGGR